MVLYFDMLHSLASGVGPLYFFTVIYAYDLKSRIYAEERRRWLMT